MPCFYASGRQLVITHGFMKKSDNIPPEEIKRANRILAEDIAREQREQQREDREQ
jgi:phage-related protein